MITHPGQSLPVAEPIAGPIDVNFLIDIIFPPEDRNSYEVETSDYDGESVRVRFKFFNKTHSDLIEYLKRASPNLSHISGNGLRDWVPADKITNQLVYGDSYSQLSSFTTDYSDDDNEYPEIDEEGLINELKNLAEQVKSERKEIDDAKLNYLFYFAFEKKDTSVNLYDIKDEFFSQLNIVQFFPKSDDSNDISDLKEAKNALCFTILSYLQKFLDEKLKKKLITDPRFRLAITLWNLINTMRTIHKSYQVLKESDEKFREILKEKKYIFLKYLNNMELWLVNMLKVLEEDLDEAQYNKFQTRLVNFLIAAEGLVETIKITTLEYNSAIEALQVQEKKSTTAWWLSAIIMGSTEYDHEDDVDMVALQVPTSSRAQDRRTCGIVETLRTKDNLGDAKVYKCARCNFEIDRDHNTTRNILLKHLSQEAILGTGYFLYKLYNRQEITKSEKLFATGLGAVGTSVLVVGHVAIKDLQKAIQRQTSMIKKLRDVHDKTVHWTRCGKDLQQWDQVMMNQHRNILSPQLNQIKIQSKAFEKIFDDPAENE
ncbi:9245_t:CDS:10 [Acaulospora morrowiae]|uniref:9245_t:CDS:1 n=1 Tax=Acaulospora morrowiae TaxID=94023 RepID=A0A9N9AR17_9GLOM|nr:9245_t:CDS:10 [Acaulospora morrowiae]